MLYFSSVHTTTDTIPLNALSGYYILPGTRIQKLLPGKEWPTQEAEIPVLVGA